MVDASKEIVLKLADAEVCGQQGQGVAGVEV